jgi:hypothetical protein
MAQTLTDKEQRMLDSVKQGMDEPGKGWLHEIDPFNGSKVTSGVISSLIRKGLITSCEDKEFPGCFWVELV